MLFLPSRTKELPVALAGEQLWALSQTWPWLKVEHLLQLLVSFQNLLGFSHPLSPGRFCPPELQEMQVENCSPELSPGLTGCGKGSMGSSVELLPSLAGMFTGTCSYQPRSAFTAAGQKERTEGERQPYLKVKDNFINCGSQHQC